LSGRKTVKKAKAAVQPPAGAPIEAAFAEVVDLIEFGTGAFEKNGAQGAAL